MASSAAHAQVTSGATEAVSSASTSLFAATPTPDLYVEAFFESVRRFGEAVADQSELSEAQNLRWDRFGLLAAYAFSIYGISTFFVALILNRTAVIASLAGPRLRLGRVPRFLALFRRLPVPQGVALAFLRASAVFLLCYQAHNVFVALALIGRHLDPLQVTRLTRMIPAHWFEYDPYQYASDKYMQMPRHEVRIGPTTAMLWPVFVTFSYSLFVETFAAAISNTRPFLEGGLTLFELSLAIQEMSSGFFFLRKHTVAKRPLEEILLMCLFALVDQVANHIGAVAYANRYRLIPLTILSSVFVWYFCTLMGLGAIFSLPLEIALTYATLVLTLAVIGVCGVILVLTVVTKGGRIDELNLAHFFAATHPHHELFATHLGLDLLQDFYTAVINLGLVAVTQAGKLSYFTAYNYVASPRDTWLERGILARFQRLEGTAKTPSKTPLLLSPNDQTHRILAYLGENGLSGYCNIISHPSPRLINGLDEDHEPALRVASIKLRVVYFTETIRRFAQLCEWLALYVFFYWPKEKIFGRGRGRRCVSDNVNDNPNVNVNEEGFHEESEAEFEARRARAPRFIRHLLVRNGTNGASNVSEPSQNNQGFVEESFSADLDEDESPDFEVVETDSNASDWESDSDDGNDGYDNYDNYDKEKHKSIIVDISNTTASSTLYRGSNQSALEELMTPDTLIELIEDRDILHQHLHHEAAEKGMLTRSRFRAMAAGTRSRNSEMAALVDLLLTKRKNQSSTETANTAHGANGAGGIDDIDDIDPRIACVICQVEPRTLITWPCKCFAICEGCRVSLVAKGMKGCVCCRQDVEGVSRIYLP